MSNQAGSDSVRTTPLTADEIVRFSRQGFLLPGRLLGHEQLDILRKELEQARTRERESGREYNLLDPGPGAEGDKLVKEQPKSVGLLINLWHWNDHFRQVALSPILGRWTAQLIGSRQVRLLEDDAIYKEAGKGGGLTWHQDFPYWPIAQPNALTVWIALDDTTEANGAMRMAVGSHLTGETLPADFGTGAPYLQESRPDTVRAIGDPEKLGYEIVPVELRAGEVSIHHSLTWHASGSNQTVNPRRAFVVRYVGDGTIWLGSRRYKDYKLPTDPGIAEGDALGGHYFPIVPF